MWPLTGECASSDQECPAVWVIVICEAAIRDRTHTTAVCNLNGDGWSDSMGSHTWVDVDIIVSGFLRTLIFQSLRYGKIWDQNIKAIT